mmetsp:Transcript_23535/g.38237  ORF Transcript_23535/g.38237 Transcript_23535/m.38237 type:complete len:334 (+) Transcript_23535:827-1828(+)
MSTAFHHFWITNVSVGTLCSHTKLVELQRGCSEGVANGVFRLQACVWRTSRDAIRRAVLVTLLHFGGAMEQWRALRSDVPMVKLCTGLSDDVAHCASRSHTVDVWCAARQDVGRILGIANLHFRVAHVHVGTLDLDVEGRPLQLCLSDVIAERVLGCNTNAVDGRCCGSCGCGGCSSGSGGRCDGGGCRSCGGSGGGCSSNCRSCCCGCCCRCGRGSCGCDGGCCGSCCGGCESAGCSCSGCGCGGGTGKRRGGCDGCRRSGGGGCRRGTSSCSRGRRCCGRGGNCCCAGGCGSARGCGGRGRCDSCCRSGGGSDRRGSCACCGDSGGGACEC